MPCEIKKFGGTVYGVKACHEKIILECERKRSRKHSKKSHRKPRCCDDEWCCESPNSKFGGDCKVSCFKTSKKHKSCEPQCPPVPCDLDVRKTLLEYCVVSGSETGAPDVTVYNYEIVLSNKSCKRLDNLSVMDSFFCLKLNADPALSEIDPNLTEVSSDNVCVKVNNFAKIVSTGGELVECGSSVPPCSVVRLCLRVGVKHVRVGTDGTVFPCESTPAQFGLSCNTATVKGVLAHVDRCGCVTKVECFLPLIVKADSCLPCPVQCPEDQA